MARTKKVKASGRFRAGYGKRPREKFRSIEEKQRKKQACPFCNKKTLKRISKGVFQCKNCKKKFASGTYYFE